MAGPRRGPAFFMRWQRILVVGGFLAAGVALAYISFAWRFMNPAPPGRVLNLPETLSPRRSAAPQRINLTRLGPARGLAEGVRTWSGMLVDAGCGNRQNYMLQTPARETLAGPASAHAEQQGAARSPKVPEEATENRVPDVVARQMDVACAITGATTGFAILLDNGQLKDLDEGGNTFAWEAVQATLLGGTPRGVKPRAVLQGTLRNDEIIVESLRLKQGQAPNAPAPEQTTPLRQP